MNSPLTRWRSHAGAVVVDTAFRALSRVGRLHPLAKPARHNVTVERDVSYGREGSQIHRLDVYRPSDLSGPLPVVLYIHGGGFRILSKETHWLMGLSFARKGFVVFNIDYRLAPMHPFPAALEDACEAFVWLSKNAERFGADLNRLILAGESAGANLITSLAVATSYRRDEPYARAVFDSGVRPIAAIPACGILQVSDVARFIRAKKSLPFFVADRLREVSEAYLTGAPDQPAGIRDLADPLVVLERAVTPDRPLPPMFAPVGTRDPILDDTRRLKKALERLGTSCEVAYYPGEVHAFHAFIWRANARKCWRDTFAFLDRIVPKVNTPS